MSIYKGGKLLASSIQYHPDIFDWKWSDHICNDVQWLRADTFSWHSGEVYEAAYQHLVDEASGLSGQSETIAGITVWFVVAADGHKICPANQESNVAAIYSATGVAWYYILDTTNQRFKLPRTKFGFTGIRSSVGKYVSAGLPNITGSSYGYVSSASRGASGALQMSGGSSKDATGGGGWWVEGVTVSVDASAGNSIYGASDTVQPKATEMYLYFYVGNFTQTALENTAGLNAELFNGKADVSALDTKTAHVVTEFQEPTSANNYTWYRKYADGWVEQGGRTMTSTQTITFPVAFANVPNMTWGFCTQRGGASYDGEIFFRNITTTNFVSGSRLTDARSPGFMWRAEGMAA